MSALSWSRLFGLVWILTRREVKQAMLRTAQYKQQEEILKKHPEQDKVTEC